MTDITDAITALKNWNMDGILMMGSLSTVTQ